ncbi:unnamed protein product [uncultured bacterium]|nr:unnamed protein product [uncultured bacterium]
MMHVIYGYLWRLVLGLKGCRMPNDSRMKTADALTRSADHCEGASAVYSNTS